MHKNQKPVYSELWNEREDLFLFFSSKDQKLLIAKCTLLLFRNSQTSKVFGDWYVRYGSTYSIFLQLFAL